MDQPDGLPAEVKRGPGRPRGSQGKQTLKYLTLGASPKDHELVDFISEQLGGTSKAEAVRTAIRAYAMHLESISRRSRT